MKIPEISLINFKTLKKIAHAMMMLERLLRQQWRAPPECGFVMAEASKVAPGTVLSVYVGEELEDETRRLMEDFQEVQTLQHIDYT